MAEERAAQETEPSLFRVSEDMAELNGEMRQIDRRLSSLEQGQQDLRKDIRQILYLVIVTILVPIILQVLRETAGP